MMAVLIYNDGFRIQTITYIYLALWRAINFPKESLSLFSLWVNSYTKVGCLSVCASMSVKAFDHFNGD